MYFCISKFYQLIFSNYTSEYSKYVGQISTVIADAGANIVDMLNKSRDEVAYTLIDLESEISDTVIDNLKQIEGILTVRGL